MLSDREVKAHRKGGHEQNEVLQTLDGGLPWNVVTVSKYSEIPSVIHTRTRVLIHMGHNLLFGL